MKETDNLLQQKDIDYLAKEVAELKQTMATGFALIHTKLEIFNENYVKRVELDTILKTRDERLDSMQNNVTWIVRTIIGSIVLGLISVVFMNK